MKLQVGKRTVGEIEGEVFVKKVIAKKHYFKIFGGYGISDSVLEALDAAKINEIHIIQDSKVMFSTTVEDYRKHGKYYNFRGDDQTVLDVGWTHRHTLEAK